MELFFKLIVAHALMDFTMQPDMMAKAKHREWKRPDHIPAWWYWMLSHALVHGGAVYFVTGQWELGVLETGLHCCIDFMKCEKWTNQHVDQLLHLLCKILYVFS